MSAPTEISTYEEAFATLYELGWHQCKIDAFFDPDLSYPSHRVRLEEFRPSYQQTFYGASIAEAFAKAVTELARSSHKTGSETDGA